MILMQSVEVTGYIQKYYPNRKIEKQNANLTQWLTWYKGLDEKFHKYSIYNGETHISRQKKSLKMAKKCSEDWSNLLLNEKCSINVKDDSQDFLDKILMENSFWSEANQLIEKSFALSMGALVESLDNLTITDKGNIIKTKDAKVKIDYLNALKIYPITFKDKKLVECAFVSENTNSVNISIHKLNEMQEYDIINLTIPTDADGKSKPVIENIFHSKSKKPLYQIIKPNIANNDDLDSPLGISVFANAIDELKAIDNSYDALDTEIELGRRRIFIDARIGYRVNEKGDVISGFDTKDAAYYQLPPRDDGANDEVKEFATPLRILDLTTALQENLNTFAASVGFGKNYYTFGANGGGRPINTATGIIAQNSDLFRNIKKHELLLEKALTDMVEAIAYLVNTFTLDKLDDEEITINFDDSIIEDTESEKTSDRTDVTNGVMSKVEYRMKWYGEDEETAKNNLEKFSLNDLDARLNALTGALTSGAINPQTFVNEVYKGIDETEKEKLIEYIEKSLKESSEPISLETLGLDNE